MIVGMEPDQTRKTRKMRKTRKRLAAALCAGYFLVLLDVTVVNVALPDLGASLHASGSELAWVVDAHAVPLAALLLAAGTIGDRLGHRNIVITGFAGFGTASVLCGLAPGLPVLIAARALQGISAALMLLPGTLPLPLLGTFAGRLAGRLGPWHTSAYGLAASAAGFAGIAVNLSHPAYPVLACALAVWGAGLGILTPAIVTAALRAVPGASGTASGASNTARQAGQPSGAVDSPGCDPVRATWEAAGMLDGGRTTRRS